VGTPDRKGHGQTFRRSEIAKTRSASALYLYRARNLIERFFNKIKQCRRVATRYDKLAANYLAFVKLASIRIWLRATSLLK
jgi:transposase